jgi:hypothetical protein
MQEDQSTLLQHQFTLKLAVLITPFLLAAGCSTWSTVPLPTPPFVYAKPVLLCLPASIELGGGNGTSIDQAIVITGPRSRYCGSYVVDDWLQAQNRLPASEDAKLLKRIEERMIQVVENRASDHFYTNFFDVTDFWDKHELGRLRFLPDYGKLEERLISDSSVSWMDKNAIVDDLIGHRSGTVTCQIEMFPGVVSWESGRFKEGKREGLWKVWQKDGGESWWRGYYRCGQATGLGETWYEDGTKQAEITSRQGKLHGVWKQWYEDGCIMRIAQYRNGLLHGRSVYWHDDGPKSCVAHYRNGKLHGQYKKWHPNGSLEWEAEYNMGKLAAAPKEWDTSGNLTPKCRRETPIISRLCDAGLSFSRLEFGDDGLCFLHLGDSEIRDLSPLVGLPITHLALAGCPVSDLRPLTNISSLVALNLHSTEVRDITPLKGMSLRILTLIETQVTDLRPAAEMPLEHLMFDAERITNGMSELRRITTLKEINWEPASEFWQRYSTNRKE